VVGLCWCISFWLIYLPRYVFVKIAQIPKGYSLKDWPQGLYGSWGVLTSYSSSSVIERTLDSFIFNPMPSGVSTERPAQLVQQETNATGFCDLSKLLLCRSHITDFRLFIEQATGFIGLIGLVQF